MHPVEATLYYSAALIPVALGLHPVSLFILFFVHPSFSFRNLAALLSSNFYQLVLIIVLFEGARIGRDH